MLCSVIKHLGGGGAQMKCRGIHSTMTHVVLYTSFVLYRFLHALQQNRTQASLFVNLGVTPLFHK